MGLRNCCPSNKEKDNEDYFESIKTNNGNDLVKPVFSITSRDKIKTFDFSESYKVKRYKLKNKKRMLVITEGNVISIFSFYLGNLIFLMTSFKVSERYNILKCCFLSKVNSTRFCLVLEDNIDKKVEMLIIKIKKVAHLPNVELNINKNETANVDNTAIAASNKTAATAFESNKEDTQVNSTTHPSLNERNKRAVEAIINSSLSSSDINSIEDEVGIQFDKIDQNGKIEKIDTTEDKIAVPRHYDSELTNNYFKILTKKQARKQFDDLLLIKYNFYTLEIKLIIDDDNESVSQIKIEEDYIYLLSSAINLIKCYKIKQSLKTFNKILSLELSTSDHFLDLIFPIYRENIFVIDGLDFIYYYNKEVLFKRHFKDFFLSKTNTSIEDSFNKEIKNVDFIKFTKVIKTVTKYKLKKETESTGSIINFYIAGLCNLNRKINDQPLQFISSISLDFNNKDGDTNPNENENVHYKEPSEVNLAPLIRTKIKILKNVPFLSEISFGPFDNGPFVTGHIDGSIILWNIYDLTITKVIRVFQFNCPVNKIISEPLGISMCSSDSKIISTHIIDKKFEYFYNENANNELERVIRYNTAN